jgi:hypothetical protein
MESWEYEQRSQEEGIESGFHVVNPEMSGARKDDDRVSTEHPGLHRGLSGVYSG